LPNPTILQGDDYFNISLWTGNSTGQTITNSGAMQPDFVWVKDRTNAYTHVLTDSVRGVSKQLFSNLTNAETSEPGKGITAFNANGFTLGDELTVTGSTNANGDSYVGWQWRASNAAGVTNTAGTITSTVSVNTTAGFSIVTYTGNNTSGATVGHGLGVVPAMVICKNRSAGIGSGAWPVWHKSLTGGTYYFFLNTTAGQTNANNNFTALPTSTVLNLGTSDTNNTATMVAYCFAEVAGYSSFGSYTGTGSSDGAFVYTGFRPRYVLFRRIDTTGGAAVVDSSRDPFNVAGQMLYPYGADAEGTNPYCDLVSNGFKVRGTSLFMNASGGS
jgi:hypothetical protein